MEVDSFLFKVFLGVSFAVLQFDIDE